MPTHVKNRDAVPKGSDRTRSSPTSGAEPPVNDGEAAGRVASAYLKVFGRPPIGDHPELDGYSAGRTLAKEYPEAMMKVMQGFRRGVEEVQKTAEGQGGHNE